MAKCPIAVCVPLDASRGYSAGKQPFKISHRTRYATDTPRDVSDPGADSEASTDYRISRE